MGRSSGPARFAASVLCGILVGIPPLPVAAHTQNLGWGDCNWLGREYGDTSIEVRVDPNNPFPANSTAPDTGARQSFTDRIPEGIDAWNDQMAAQGLAIRGVYAAPGTTPVMLSYSGPQKGDPNFQTNESQRLYGSVGATTSIDGFQYGCDVHFEAPNDPISRAVVTFDRYYHYFVQGWDQRSWWESTCPSQPHTKQYSCRKDVDFGGIMTHELGHALGFILHPNRVDLHTGSTTDAAARFASCFGYGFTGYTQATMCPLRVRYRSESRTLEYYDSASFRELVINR